MTNAPTTRETADHAELARLAEAAQRVQRDSLGRLYGQDAYRKWDAFTAAFTPAVCSALLSEIAALRGEVERVEADRIRTVDDRMTWTRRAYKAERQRDELRKALERQCDNMSFVLNRVELHAWADKFSREVAEDRAFIASQGAGQ